MSATEQQLYEMLTRTDHPVFFKDYAATQNANSPLNSIWNRIMAKQFVRIRAVMDELQLNLVPDTVTDMTIDDWELEYFGFTKPSLTLAQRVHELLIKFNKRFTMSVKDAEDLALAIVGLAPIITRGVDLEGWVLGQGALGISTTLGGSAAGDGLYLVNFTTPVDSALLAKLDEALTSIEKAGSTHKLSATIPHWILGQSALGVNTILGV